MTVLPLIKKILAKPVMEIYNGIKDIPYSFILETGLNIKGLGSHTFIGADPFMVLTSKDGGTEICYRKYNSNQTSFVKGDPLTVLQQVMGTFKQPVTTLDTPFAGGAVGYFSYDFGRQFEKIPAIAVDDLPVPDYCFGLYDVVLAINNASGQTTIISTGLPEKGEGAVTRARERAGWLERVILDSKNNDVCHPVSEPGDVTTHFTKEEYENAVSAAIEHILCGDIFQVNLSQRFEIPASINSWPLFQRLRKINPAPFSAYLDFNQLQILCSSPERFLKLDHLGEVETCPIKGTRPRGKNEEEDETNYLALKNSLKDKAELTMIVDLERNDLGRICEIGSIRVKDCFRIETYPTVFHLVSTIKGQLPKDKDIFHLIRASFPGGSITGAPKIKAMEIIERLEPVRRGVYTGSLGYVGFDGRADLNIVIRTIVKVKDKYYFQVGGGITADSDPEAEYYETLDKARALMHALGLKRS